jgi:hypothetical protein
MARLHFEFAAIISIIALVSSSHMLVAPACAEVAQITVDCNNPQGEISDYVFGTSQPRESDPEACWDRARESGFKVMYSANYSYTPGQDMVELFAGLDASIDSIHSLGAEVLMGGSIGRKPQDMTAYEGFIHDLAVHINDKYWDDTAEDKGGVRLWRFCNEPDNVAFWEGTVADWCETYKVWATAIKAVNPQFIVESFSLMKPLEENQGQISDHLGDFAQTALDYCLANNVPVDCFAFHGYSPVTYKRFYYTAGIIASKLTTDYPQLSPLYGVPKIGNDEWNLKMGDQWSGNYGYDPIFNTVNRAAHNIMALIEMLDQGLWFSTLMGGLGNAPGTLTLPNGTPEPLPDGHDFPLVYGDGSGKPAFYASKGFNMLLETPILLTAQGGNHVNLAACAGKSSDGNKVIVVLVNYDVEKAINDMEGSEGKKEWERGYLQEALAAGGFIEVPEYGQFSVTINNLNFNTVAWERFNVDSTHNLVSVGTGILQGSSIILEGEMEYPSVQVFVLSPGNDATPTSTATISPTITATVPITPNIAPTATATPVDIASISPGLARMYPMPAKDRICFEWPGKNPEKIKINIYNLRGELTTSAEAQGVPRVWLENLHLAPGIYLAHIMLTLPDGTREAVVKKVAIIR